MSSQYLSRRDVEDLHPSLEKAIYRCLGYADASLLSTASSCLVNGYDRRKIADKLSGSGQVDSKKAARLAEKVLQIGEEALASLKSSKKRSHDGSGKDRDSKKSKSDSKSVSNGNGNTNVKDENKEKKEESAQEPVTLSADRIRAMMMNAQKEIEERKRTLNVLKNDENKVPYIGPNLEAVNAAKAAAAQIRSQITAGPPASVPPPGVAQPVLYSRPAPDLDKQKRMAELQAKIQSKLSGLGAAGAAAAAAVAATATSAEEKPRPLILDREGRTVDVTGRQVQLTQVLPTLKANIRAKKREEMRAQTGTKSGTAAEQEEATWFDSRVAMRPSQRNKRALRFNEPGKFQQLADRIRMKAQLEKLQNEISQIARKTGISSATKLALLAPDVDDGHEIPYVEWWDNVILMTPEERDASIAKRKALGIAIPEEDDPDDMLSNIKTDAISNLVEHPTQLKPSNESQKPVYMPVFLTKKERKKLRRQTRREAWKEEQEKVRLGLEAPAEPKLRISNLMRVLGSEAVQDPTKIEAHVREQMARRKRAHEEANAARRLTKEQRSERRATKLKEDTSTGVHVGVYRVKDLFETAAKKFKVEKNAQQLFMTGCVILHRGCCVVITEGGPKQHGKYKKLMTRRIRWEEDTIKDMDGNPAPNSCRLVWEGVAKHRCFGELRFKVCPTERAARDHLAKHRAQHYWDLAYSGSVLDQEEEPI